MQAYSTPARKTIVSTGGGVAPVWRRDGRELCYLRGGEMFAVSIAASRPGEAPAIGVPTRLLRATYVEEPGANYDVAPDGKRFAIVTAKDSTSRLVVELHALER